MCTDDNNITAAMIFKKLGEDIATIMERDPASRSRLEVVLCYPGFHALVYYRLSHWLWHHRMLLLGRFVSHIGRVLTGIEIHPAARIGRRFFVDHGMGVVVGATTEIGDDVTLYQGVTLGGTSLERGVKRHPTLEDGVVVGAGAKVLGPITVGAGARIGSNAVVVGEVPAGATMVGVPGKEVSRRREEKAKKEFMAYGMPDKSGKVPDPMANALNGLLDQMGAMSRRIEQLEETLGQREEGLSAAAIESGGGNHENAAPPGPRRTDS